MITDPSGGRTDLSIVVPVFNERESLAELHERLTAVLTGLKKSYEIIFVDDGSFDGSVKLCRSFVNSDPCVVLVELRRHFNKATALQAGFEVATGEVVITMDGDLQDDANEIPRFLEALEQGFDLISGWKKKRRDCLSKRVQSRIFNRVTSLLTGVSLRDFNCGFKAYRREVIEALDLYGELHRYIPVLAHTKGFRVGEIPVNHLPRLHGKSKYHFERVFRGALDLLTILFLSSFKRRPLHLFGFVGLVFALTGFSIDLYLSSLWLTGAAYIGNRPLLILGTLLIIVGVQVLIFGLLAEMITAVTYRRSEVMELVCRVNRHLSRPLGPGQRATERQFATEGAA